MENNSRTEMLPGKRDLYRSCKARRSASHVNKEFWQFQNYAPPSLRVIRTKFARRERCIHMPAYWVWEIFVFCYSTHSFLLVVESWFQ